ncbi:MAG: tRNA 2-thiouridine(34) synthase MnmA [Desulfobacterota bacterium]|nr:tRNA 2-thiouridine(34) synthase MnmA [Thermodesulfobacteriota bacterium]MDW8001265.1 tRNA 2-thiouridine(34) synthase MnmA [Deltaproteobacteria bacterium]
MKIAVGLSGGFDSSIAAYLLAKKGYELIGVTMRIWDGKISCTTKKNACYGPDEEKDIEFAQKISEKLSIPHYVIDLRDEYREFVLNYFFLEYRKGRTPNPCVVCNSKIKFGFLIEKVRSLGLDFDCFATGHYARIEFDPERKRYHLKRGVDEQKDQSYFLYRLTQDQLKTILFPLGDFRKNELKMKALDFGLEELAKRRESQDFFADDYRLLFEDCGEPGNIVDVYGNVIGRHKGICHYTVGQRRYLNLAGLKEPYYVLKIDPERNEIVAGPKRYLFSSSLLAKDLNWLLPPEEVKGKKVFAKVRSTARLAECTFDFVEDMIVVRFTQPQEGITPGQSVVLYDGEVVIGGGIIESYLSYE